MDQNEHFEARIIRLQINVPSLLPFQGRHLLPLSIKIKFCPFEVVQTQIADSIIHPRKRQRSRRKTHTSGSDQSQEPNPATPSGRRGGHRASLTTTEKSISRFCEEASELARQCLNQTVEKSITFQESEGSHAACCEQRRKEHTTSCWVVA
jgi:hypothetical protein